MMAWAFSSCPGVRRSSSNLAVTSPASCCRAAASIGVLVENAGLGSDVFREADTGDRPASRDHSLSIGDSTPCYASIRCRGLSDCNAIYFSVSAADRAKLGMGREAMPYVEATGAKL